MGKHDHHKTIEYIEVNRTELKRAVYAKGMKLYLFCSLNHLGCGELREHLSVNPKRMTKQYHERLLAAIAHTPTSEDPDEDQLEDIPITAEDVHNNFT